MTQTQPQNPACPFCASDGGQVLWRNAECRIIDVADLALPGFCRVIWQQHVKEMTDLTEQQRVKLMTVLFRVETLLRSYFSPDKINLASLGNQTPHLHWHVIPRWQGDEYFPDSVWSAKRRTITVNEHVDLGKWPEHARAYFAQHLS